MGKFEVSIKIPDVDIMRVEAKREEILLYVEPTDTFGHCNYCGNKIHKYHGRGRERRFRHMPILGKPTFIIYKAKRYYCDDCNKTSTMTGSWHKRNSQCTLDYETHVLMELVNSTVRDVSIKENLTEASVNGIMERRIESKADWNTILAIDMLGLDEISWNDQIISRAQRPQKATIKAFLCSIP